MVDEWSSKKKKNMWGNVVETQELESEGGVAGATHGAVCTGSLTATFTCSQGLLLMIPNMYKLAYEMHPCVIHVASRLVAHHAMSLYCDYSDINACLPTGFTFLCSSTPQECMDLGTIAHLLTCKTSIPVLHFFDGLRTSHSYHKIAPVDEAVIREMFPYEEVRKWRETSMNPEHPTMRGGGQNTDIYWQCTEKTAPYFRAVPDACAAIMRRFGELTGRVYHTVDYFGAPDAEDVLVLMGSGAASAQETVNFMVEHEHRKVGVIAIRLYRPFPARDLLAALPATCKRLCVLDRIKQVTAAGEPLYLETLAAVFDSDRRGQMDVLGGKFGVGGAEFNPCHIRAVFANMQAAHPIRRFSVGLDNDVTPDSLPVVLPLSEEALRVPQPPSPIAPGTHQALFYGRGSDGTVGSCKTATTLIGMNTNMYTQGYFIFDAKKTGGFTFCHLRFGPKPIQAEYEIYESDYTACHHHTYVHQFEVGRTMKPNSIFVLNSPWETLESLERNLPATLKRQIAQRNVRFYNIDAMKLAQELKLGSHINMIMQACFFSLSGVLPIEQALPLLKDSIVKMYSKKGNAMVQANIAVIDRTLERLRPVEYPKSWAQAPMPEPQLHGDKFLDEVAEPILHMRAQFQPVSKFPDSVARGIFPTNTSKIEKRGIATAVPVWDPTNCHECTQCAAVCPHAAIRPYVIDPAVDPAAPFPTKKLIGMPKDAPQGKDYQFRIQVSPQDCQGCTLCVSECNVHALRMHPFEDEQTQKDTENWEFCQRLPNHGAEIFKSENVRDIQFRTPLLEFNAACAGCSEPTYMKLVTQLLGPQIFVANAVGCSMVWGGYTPTSPYVKDAEGNGPAYATSLFEDNAEFGFGITVAVRNRRANLRTAVEALLGMGAAAPAKAIAATAAATAAAAPAAHPMPEGLEPVLREWLTVFDDMVGSKRCADRIKAMLRGVEAAPLTPMRWLLDNQDYIAAKTTWVVGGDGWAYDIDFHGLDHLLHSTERTTIMIFDTEVYSNTGGQASKATSRGVSTKLLARGKPSKKKELALYAMNLHTCYVASVALGANKAQFIKAVTEAEKFNGPSIIVCYCPCIAHGLKEGLEKAQSQQKMAVQSGYWPLFRFNPDLAKKGTNPLTIDYQAPISSEPAAPVPAGRPAAATLHDFLTQEMRFNSILERQPEVARQMEAALQEDIDLRNRKLRRLVELYAPAPVPKAVEAAAPAAAPAAQ
eukprot:GAFH01000717.1.p2 GENE.GAFH01000717.1~~GAFH01000717.1.p2  ORF type:complete len:1259 (-),score=633.04 GAFH01000717.1:320-3961(-)